MTAAPTTAPPAPADRIRLGRAQFASLASGYGDAAALRALAAGQYSRRLLLIRAVADRARPLSAGPDATGLDAALELLAVAHQRAPATVTQVIAHPYIGAWAHRCLRLLGRSGDHDPADALRNDLPHLRAIAVAAALRAGLDAEVTMPTRAGTIALPTLGTAHGLGEGTALLRTVAGDLEIVGPAARVAVPSAPERPTPGWAPRPEVDLGGLVLAIEDSDPYRSCYPWPPRGRLDPEAVRRVSQVLTQAWRLIQQEHPSHAVAMAASVRSVVPVSGPGHDRWVSATSRLAYGSLALSVPDDPTVAALLLLHEFQHMKLGGLLDLVALHHPGGAARHLAPWRSDPRPVGALLQGTYAHLGVADFWRRRRRTGPDRRLADFEFAYWLAQTARAAESLAHSGELTAEGTEFVRLLRTTLRAWVAEPVPPEVSHAVQLIVDEAEVRWRLSNARPDVAVVARLRDQWRRGAAPDPVPVSPIRPAPGAPALLTGLSARIRDTLAGRARPAAGVSAAERCLLDGDFASSVGLYQDHLRPGDDEAWAALAVAMSRTDEPGAATIRAVPELVRALHAALLRTDSHPVPVRDQLPEPRRLAAWLSAALAPPGDATGIYCSGSTVNP